MVRYVQPRYITGLDLGPSGAAYIQGWDRRVHLTGADAKAIKRRINREVIYPPQVAGREELLALSTWMGPSNTPLAATSPNLSIV